MANPQPDLFAIQAHIRLVEADTSELLEYLPDLGSQPRDGTWRGVQFADFRDITPTLTRHRLLNKKVGIVGGGIAGLYAARLLEYVGIPSEVIESSGRIGGRLYTYHFYPNSTGYDYFDVGAMRFPDTPFMRRTFNLVRWLNDEEKDSVKLIKYHMSESAGEKTYKFYNNVHHPRTIPGELPPDPEDPYKISTYVPEKFAWARNPDSVKSQMQIIMSDLRRGLLDDGSNLEEFIKQLIEQYDQYTMRSYLQLKLGFPSSVVTVIETLKSSTGAYDRGLVQSVLEDLAFQWRTEDTATAVEWFCFDHGSSQLAEAVAAQLKAPIKRNTRVTAIRNIQTDPERSEGLVVTSEATTPNGEKIAEDTEYAAVISTLTLSTLGLVDLSQAGIHSNYAQWSAIRQLLYGSAIKIGIRFSRNWWGEQPTGIIGSQSATDRPLRAIVYPSYPETGTKSRVLIVSYCWTQDADRMGALFDHYTGKINELLLTMVLKELALLHGLEYNFLRDLVEDRERDCFAHDWSRDPHTMGAYAEFGPSQYADEIFTSMTQPAANGQLWFAGEAISTAHAWVAGALESAERAVFGIMKTFGCPEEDFERLRRRLNPDGKKYANEVYEEEELRLLERHIKLGLAHAGIEKAIPRVGRAESS
ncbi:FAD/NAD(P)-binding domain-containing protein [Trametopsis cervina]|nr:FAD/NAD(P)-binding domain-containing protein [Trametopsis cervina]